MRLLNILLIAVASLFVSSASYCSEEEFFGSIDVQLKQERESEPVFEYKGFVKQKIKYGLNKPDEVFGFDRDKQGILQIRTDFFGEVEGEVTTSMRWQASGKFETNWVLWEDGELEWKFNHEKYFLKDAFVDITFDSGLWLRAGHQLFAWGESEGLVITDVLSPRDLREPGQAELRDIREQVPAILVSIPAGQLNLSAVASYNAGHNQLADKNEEFYPYLFEEIYGQPIKEKDPKKKWELAVKLDYQFNGGDLTLVAANVNDNQPMFVGLSRNNEFIFTQERVKVLGFSVVRVKDKWLFKAEAGRYWDQPMVGSVLSPMIHEDQWRTMMGFEYSGWNDWLFSFEVNNISTDDSYRKNVINYESNRSDTGRILRIRHTSFNERLINQLRLVDVTGDQSKVVRWNVLWEWSNNIELGASLVIYEIAKSSSVLYPYRNHDSLNLSVTFSF